MKNCQSGVSLVNYFDSDSDGVYIFQLIRFSECASDFQYCCLTPKGSQDVVALSLFLLSPCICFTIILNSRHSVICRELGPNTVAITCSQVRGDANKQYRFLYNRDLFVYRDDSLASWKVIMKIEALTK